MERYSKRKKPAEKVNNKQPKKNCYAFTQTKNDNDRTVIDNILTQCVIQDNVKKNQNDIKHTKLGNESDSILSTSNTDCSIASTKTVPECDDILNKNASTFIKKVLYNELPNDKQDKQSSLIAMILSRRSAKLAELHLEDEILMKSAEIICLKTRYGKQINDVQMLKDVQRTWKRKFQRLNLFVDSINSQLDALNRLPNPNVKHVRNVGTNCNLLI